MNGSITVRREVFTDKSTVRAVNEAAFGTDVEANLVDALRVQASPIVSLVGLDDDVVVGHIMFSPVTLLTDASVKIMGLAPMAVLPSHQRRGVGSALVRAGLGACGELGFGAVVVLGHRDYYPRFGFRPASQFGLRSEYDVPDNVFMALELHAGILTGTSGTIRYHDAFAGV